MSDDLTYTKSSGNVFKDMGFSEQEARIYQFRSYLMITLTKYIQAQGLTQIEAANMLGVPQSRISHLIHSKIDLFSTGMLLDMMERAGFQIYERIGHDIEDFMLKQPFFNNMSSGLSSKVAQ